MEIDGHKTFDSEFSKLGIFDSGMGRGRTSSWNNPTKMIRLPAVFESKLIEVARSLDLGKKVFSESEMKQHVDAVLLSLRPGDRRFARRVLNSLLERVKDD